MQGWGNLVNTAVLCALLAIFGQTGSKYNHHALDAVWRISFGLGLIPVTAMLVYRLFFLQESKVWVRQNKPASVSSLSSHPHPCCSSSTLVHGPAVVLEGNVHAAGICLPPACCSDWGYVARMRLSTMCKYFLVKD